MSHHIGQWRDLLPCNLGKKATNIKRVGCKTLSQEKEPSDSRLVIGREDAEVRSGWQFGARNFQPAPPLGLVAVNQGAALPSQDVVDPEGDAGRRRELVLDPGFRVKWIRIVLG